MADEPKKVRKIFEYEYMGETRKVDPLRIHLALYEGLAGEDDAALWREAFPDKPPEGTEVKPEAAAALFHGVTWPARKKFVEATLKAFGIPELQPDGTGLTDEEAFELFLLFDEWFAATKKDTAPQPSDMPSTEGSTGGASVTEPSAG